MDHNSNEFKKAVAEIAKTAIGANGYRTAFAELLINTIEPNHLSLDIFSTFLPTVQKNIGDQVGRRVRRGRYPIRTMVPKYLGL